MCSSDLSDFVQASGSLQSELGIASNRGSACHGEYVPGDVYKRQSLGNGIDPLEVIAQYGADALRFMLVDGSTPGNDMRYIEKKVEAARNFANKLWNCLLYTSRCV